MIKTVKAYAKINLSLDVIRKRSDNYHDLKSVMQSVSLCDDITLETQPQSGITIETDSAFLVRGSKNIAHKAAALFLEKSGIKTGLRIYIKKRIPIGAGLGGGSADAAAVLLGLNEMNGFILDNASLLSLGLSCGADVPFCLTGGTALAEGLGELLTPLPPLPGCIILIAKPAFSVSTKAVFENFDAKTVHSRPDTDGIIANLRSGNLPLIAVRMYNVFENGIKIRHSEIGFIKNTLLDCGALGSVMTGTGSAVFGIFTEEKKAAKAASILEENNIRAFQTLPN